MRASSCSLVSLDSFLLMKSLSVPLCWTLNSLQVSSMPRCSSFTSHNTFSRLTAHRWGQAGECHRVGYINSVLIALEAHLQPLCQRSAARCKTETLRGTSLSPRWRCSGAMSVSCLLISSPAAACKHIAVINIISSFSCIFSWWPVSLFSGLQMDELDPVQLCARARVC